MFIMQLNRQYDGDKWDNFYEKIPISLLHHTNGNAIYNTSHPLLERLVGQLEVEAPCPYNSIPYDYRMSQMWVEGTLGIVTEVLAKIHPLPEKRTFMCYLLPDLAGGIEAGRRVMTEGLQPSEPTEGSAYGAEFGLHRHIYSAIEAFGASKAMHGILGDNFVDMYCALKHEEYREFQEIITPWEREILMFNV